MRSTSITVAKNQLSALLDEVRAGETILITDRGRPVARLSPVIGSADPLGRARRLKRAGIVAPVRAEPPLERLARPAPSTGGRTAVAVLLEERATGR